MSELYTVRTKDGRELAPDYWTGSDPLYSTVELGSGSVPILKAFSYGKGGQVPGAPNARKSTWQDTNLTGRGGVMPKEESIIVYSIAIEAFLIGVDQNDSPRPFNSLATILACQRDLVVQFWVAATTKHADSPLAWFPAAGGVQSPVSAQAEVVAGAATYANGPLANNGAPNIMGQRKLASPVFVDQGETFDVRFIPGPGQVNNIALGAESRVRLRTFLIGLRHGPTS